MSTYQLNIYIYCIIYIYIVYIYSIYIDIEGSKMPGHKPSQMVTQNKSAPPISLNIIGLTMKSFPLISQNSVVTTHWNGMNGMEDHGSGPWRSHSADICCPGRGPWTRTTPSCWRSSLKNTNSKWIEQMQRDGMGKAWLFKDDALNVRFWSNLWWMPKIFLPPLGGFSHVTSLGLPIGSPDVTGRQRWLNGVELCPWKSLVANHGQSDRPVHRPRTDDWEILLRALAVEFSSCLCRNWMQLAFHVNLERLHCYTQKEGWTH